MKNVLLMLLFGSFAFACTSKKIDNNSNSNKTEMENKHMGLYDIWGLKEMEEKPLKSRKGIILELNTNNMTFMGNAACNNISGVLELSKKNLISFKNTRATRMACPDLNIESEYLKHLENVHSYEIKSLHLLLYDVEGELLLDFIKMD